MPRKRKIWTILFLTVTSPALYAAAGRPKDGFLFFVVILGFLGLILGILHLAEIVKTRIKRFLDGIVEGLMP